MASSNLRGEPGTRFRGSRAVHYPRARTVEERIGNRRGHRDHGMLGNAPCAQRAFIMAKVLEKSHVIIVGSKTPHLVGQVHMISAATMDEAFRIAAEKIGRDELEVLVVPHALLTLPVVAHQCGAAK